MPSTSKTFIVERGEEKLEVEADRGVQEEAGTRVTFYKGEDAVASFINIQGWYPKTS